MTSLAEIRDLLNRCESEGSLDSLKQAIPHTRHHEPEVRSLATVTCTSIIKSILLDSFLEMDPDTRQGLVDLMVRLSQDVVGLFRCELHSSDASIRVRAVQILSLATKAKVEIVNHLAQLMRDHDEKLRATIISTLGHLVEKSEATVLLRLLNDMDDRVRANTIEALGSLKNPDLVGILLRFRYDSNNRIRANALKALHDLGYVNIRSSLYQMVQSESPAFRASAAWLIGELAPAEPELVRMLAKIQHSDSDLIRRNMICALLKIDTEASRAYLDSLFAPSEIREVRETEWLRNCRDTGDRSASGDHKRSA